MCFRRDDRAYNVVKMQCKMLDCRRSQSSEFEIIGVIIKTDITFTTRLDKWIADAPISYVLNMQTKTQHANCYSL